MENAGKVDAASRRVQVGITVGLLLVVALLFVFDPAAHSFFPGCLFHRITGWYCPGCGTTRALHALLHGQLLAALRFNVLAVGGLVVGLCLLGWRLITRRPIWPLVLRPTVVSAVLVVAIVFGIVRNLPWEPCRYLAPPEATGATVAGAER